VIITYEDERSLQAKVDYVKELGLAGMMFWSLDGDREEKLLDVVVNGLCDGRRLENKHKPVFTSLAGDEDFLI
jgi:chitinase